MPPRAGFHKSRRFFFANLRDLFWLWLFHHFFAVDDVDALGKRFKGGVGAKLAAVDGVVVPQAASFARSVLA